MGRAVHLKPEAQSLEKGVSQFPSIHHRRAERTGVSLSGSDVAVTRGAGEGVWRSQGGQILEMPSPGNRVGRHRARKMAMQGCKIQHFQTIQFPLQFLYLLQTPSQVPI